jgi:thymidylate synthase
MNMFALIQLQTKIAERISNISNKSVMLGRYVHQADSYHIYGSYIEEFENRFLRMYKERPFKDRTYQYKEMKTIMEEAIPSILEKVEKMSTT